MKQKPREVRGAKGTVHVSQKKGGSRRGPFASDCSAISTAGNASERFRGNGKSQLNCAVSALTLGTVLTTAWKETNSPKFCKT